jgi:hypothetical protein
MVDVTPAHATEGLMELLELIVTDGESDIGIVCHGTEDGLQLKIDPKNPTSHWLTVDAMDVLNKDLLKGEPSQDAADRLNVELSSLSQILDRIRAVRAKRLNRVIIRACLLGRNQDGLGKFKRLVGCSSVCAPTMMDSFGSFSPAAPVSSEAAWSDWKKRHPKAQIYGEKPNRVSFYPADLAQTGNYDSQVDSWNAAQLFLESHMPPGRYERGRFFYTAFVRQLQPPIFPLDAQYRAKLVRV